MYNITLFTNNTLKWSVHFLSQPGLEALDTRYQLLLKFQHCEMPVAMFYVLLVT